MATTADTKLDVEAFVADPGAYFGHDATAMHAMPRRDVAELQLEATRLRFAQQKAAIPMVGKLADNEGVSRIDRIEDIVPVLFQHTMFKSYPMSLLSSRRFDMLTKWFDKLTSTDLSQVDVGGCDSIDGWLGALQAQTDLDAITTSGTSGTMSFIPKSKRDWTVGISSNRVIDLQTFGEEPTETQKRGLYHCIWPTYSDGHLASFRGGHYYRKVFGGGRDDHFHALYPGKGSADLMWLAAQVRAAAARGDAGSVNVPDSLLARREELEAQQSGMAERQIAFVLELVDKLRGERVFCMYPSFPLFSVAENGLKAGASCHFGEGSVISSAGGSKGMTMPDDWTTTVERFFNVPRLGRLYGMSELTGMAKECSHGRYHFQPWTVVFVLDGETSELMPREGVRRGRAAFFDVMQTGSWGGLITGDEIEVDYDGPCGCGQTSIHMSTNIQRYADKRGDDKITCAGTPQAHADALEYLIGAK